MTVLTVKAKQDHLEKVASTREPVRALAEFVWNALDAAATEVRVIFQRNPMGGLQTISVADNGSGITAHRAKIDFENIGESWKRGRKRTDDNRAMHGKEGQGRLRFFSLSEQAEWVSKFREEGDEGKVCTFRIRISADALHRADVPEPKETGGDKTGTTLTLYNLKDSFDWLESDEARSEFTSIFAPYALQYPNISIIYAGTQIDTTHSIERVKDIPIRAVRTTNRTINDLRLRVIEWRSGSESRKIHFGSEDGVVLGSQPAHVTAPDFRFSAYAYSSFFQEIADANLLDFEGLNDADFNDVCAHVRDHLSDYFRARKAERTSHLIDQLKEEGVYPYTEPPRDSIEERERDVFDIATHAVSSYSKEFKRADSPTKKMTLSLLQQALRNNPESVSNILHAVFNLPKNRQDEFSELLNKTELGNIISSSSLIAERIVELEVLKTIVFEPKHRMSVKERGELDVLISNNTWIFGEQFHLTMSERGLTRVMQRVAEELGTSGRRKKVVKKLDGKSGRVDSFLGRTVPHPDGEIHEFLLIELKRPNLEIGRKELDQLEDYVNAIMAQDDFQNTDTRWNFYLVTGKYDDTVRNRITQSDRPTGVLLEKDNMRAWVKTWGELIRECEGRLRFIQDRLKVEVSEEEIERRIESLRGSIVQSSQKAEQNAETSEET